MWLIGINVYVLFLFMSLFVTVEEDAGWLEVDPEVQETVLSLVREWMFLIQAWWLKIKTALQPHLAGFLWKVGYLFAGPWCACVWVVSYTELWFTELMVSLFPLKEFNITLVLLSVQCSLR